MKWKAIFLSVFLLGFSSASAQILILRTLVASLYGNELIFVMALAAWLIGVAAGGWAGGAFRPRATGAGLAVSGWLVVSGSFVPLTVLAARQVRLWLGVTPGLLLDPLTAGVCAAALVFPLSFFYGVLFPALVAGSDQVEDGADASRVYAGEAAGLVAGGLVTTFFFLPWLSSLGIAFFLLVAHLLAAALLSPAFRGPLLAGALLTAWLLGSGTADRLDTLSRAAQWPGFRVVESRDTVYGNLELLEKDGELSLFENGLHVATTGDALSAEENVHYALLAHPAPRRLFMVGGGLAGGLGEALKHPGVSVDYVELDPAAIDLVRRHNPDVAAAMSEPRVRVLAADGRRFLRRSGGEYDVIILNLSDPLTLLVNRYYTVESFREAARHLAPGGILALSVTSSENYLNREGKEYLRILRRTLGQVFGEVRSVPGDRHIFLAAKAPGTISVEPDTLAARIKERGLKTRFVREAFFRFRLEAGRVAQAEKNMAGGTTVNRDTGPAAFLAALVFWSTNFRTGFAAQVAAFRGQGVWLWFFPLFLGALSCFSRQRRNMSSGLLVAAAGFCLMAGQLAVVLAFQSFYGYVYAGIGIITALFMAGVFVGAGRAGKVRAEQVPLVVSRTIAAAALLFVLTGAGLPIVARTGVDAVIAAGLALFAFLAGGVGGAQFALAVQFTAADPRQAGRLYAADVLGASLGALLAGIFFIPLWGLPLTCIFCGLLQLAVWPAFVRITVRS
ncbi:MAG: fused MFS/spermidine synthase [Candidatus Omnitrophica bacterium]|nr:fused MFS/spermidine synthase [Candidatus Omnitrophota bacterium]